MKTLVFDIETAPNLGWVWGKWEQNVIATEQEWYMLSFAAKWLGERKIYSYSLPDFKGYRKDPQNDRALVLRLWKMLDDADVVVAHNGDKFDIRKANARFLVHGFSPPAPYLSIDTLKVARAKFKFDSNRLDDLGEYLNLGRKMSTGGFQLWLKCMQGDLAAWKQMVKYNRQDVRLLEKVYLHLRPWMTNHPNINLVDTKENACPTCGSDNIQKRGHSFTRVNKFQRYQCMDCGSWSRGGVMPHSALKIR